MNQGYADNLHTVKRTIFCIAENLHRPQNAVMSSSAHHKVEVGRRLRLAIEALGLTQAEVARSFDAVTPPKLGNWLRGDNYPDEYFVKQFCDRYGVTTDWLYRGVVAGVSADVADEIWRAEQASQAAR
jgi:hypothetical protein